MSRPSRRKLQANAIRTEYQYYGTTPSTRSCAIHKGMKTESSAPRPPPHLSPVSSSCRTASHRSPVTHHEQQLPHCKRPALQATLSLTQTARCRPYHVRQCNPVPPLLPPVRRSHRCFTITTASSAGPCASRCDSASVTKSTPHSTSSRPPLRACICPAATLSSTSRRGRPAPTCACRFGQLSCSALPSASRVRQAMRLLLRLPACVLTRGRRGAGEHASWCV